MRFPSAHLSPGDRARKLSSARKGGSHESGRHGGGGRRPGDCAFPGVGAIHGGRAGGDPAGSPKRHPGRKRPVPGMTAVGDGTVATAPAAAGAWGANQTRCHGGVRRCVLGGRGGPGRGRSVVTDTCGERAFGVSAEGYRRPHHARTRLATLAGLRAKSGPSEPPVRRWPCATPSRRRPRVRGRSAGSTPASPRPTAPPPATDGPEPGLREKAADTQALAELVLGEPGPHPAVATPSHKGWDHLSRPPGARHGVDDRWLEAMPDTAHRGVGAASQ
jgi:hypothetical protein